MDARGRTAWGRHEPPRPFHLGEGLYWTRPNDSDEPTDQERRPGAHTGHTVRPEPDTGGRSVATQCQFSGDDNGGPHGLQAGGQVAPIVTPAATADQGRYRIPSPPRRRSSHLVQIARRDPFRPSQVNRRPTTDAGSHPRPLRCHPAPFTGRPLARPTLVPQLAVPSGVQRSPTVEL